MVKDVPTCYLALGALHALYKPIPGKFKDYIAIPKANGYQSLHTTLIGPFGTPVEVQIRTEDMHHVAESGVASHWMYKDDAESLSDSAEEDPPVAAVAARDPEPVGRPAEFLEHVKVDLFPDEVYVFTPKGQDPVAAARRDGGRFRLRSAHRHRQPLRGRRRSMARLVPLRTELRNGDRVEIITASHAKPNPAWLQFVRSGKARSNIRHFLKTMQYEESARLGERLLEHALRGLGSALEDIDEASWERVVRDGGSDSREAVLADIGLGKRLPAVVARRLLRHAEVAADAKPGAVVTIRGTEGMAVQLARCCRAIPGDDVIGSIKKGQGLVVHAATCRVALRSRRTEPEQWIDVEWAPDNNRLYQAEIRVTVANQRGVLGRVASEIAEAGSNIDSISMDDDRALYTGMHFVLEVSDRKHLARVMRALRRLPDVKKLARVSDA